MDPAVPKRRFGDRLCFEGGVSVQTTLPFGSPEDVRQEVRDRIDVLGRGGGYILDSTNLIQPDTSPETVAAMLPVDSADAIEPAMAEVRSDSKGNYENYLKWLLHHENTINSKPQLSGAPPSQALVEALFIFVPTATDPDGDTLTFNIMNKPTWATFDSLSGELRGTPNTSDVGEYSTSKSPRRMARAPARSNLSPLPW